MIFKCINCNREFDMLARTDEVFAMINYHCSEMCAQETFYNLQNSLE